MVHPESPYFLKIYNVKKEKNDINRKLVIHNFELTKTLKNEYQLNVPYPRGTGSRSDEDRIQK